MPGSAAEPAKGYISDTQFNPQISPTQAPKLLDRLQVRLQSRGFGLDMQNRFVELCRQFILFHGKRHPAEMGAEEVRRALENLAVAVAATRGQAW